jgi:hypothetical protein
MLQATGYRLQATGYRLQATGQTLIIEQQIIFVLVLRKSSEPIM